MVYTVPLSVGLTDFQANACETSNIGIAEVPVTASVTYNGNQATATACITVNPPTN
jgi:hypothetical protein